MGNKTPRSPLALALSTAFATSLAGISVANADQNPFAMTQLSSGYMVADSQMEGKCGKGMSMMDKNKDGAVSHAEFTEHHERAFARMDTDGDGIISAAEMAAKKALQQKSKAEEGKCGGDKMMDEADSMKQDAKDMTKGTEGKCGEGKCGGTKNPQAADPKAKEGKCGEGKCGATKKI